MKLAPALGTTKYDRREGEGALSPSPLSEKVGKGVTSVTGVTLRPSQKEGREKSAGGKPSWPSNQQRMIFPSLVLLSIAT